MNPLDERKLKKAILKELKTQQAIKSECDKFSNSKNKDKQSLDAIKNLLLNCKAIHTITTLEWVLKQIKELKK